MALEWSDIGKIISTSAPVLGGFLAGPAGAQGGAVVGSIIGTALGVPPAPDAIADAIRNDPDAEAKIAQADADHGPSIAELEANMLETVNATMRGETTSEHWFVRNSRPFNIWVIGVVTGGYGFCLVAATGAAVFWRDPAALNLLVSNAGVLGIALAPCGAVAGVYAYGRTKEKLAGVAGPISTVIDTVTKAVRK